jgi:hypothetical protein
LYYSAKGDGKMKAQTKATWENTETGERVEFLIVRGDGLSESFFVFTNQEGEQVKVDLLTLLPIKPAGVGNDSAL